VEFEEAIPLDLSPVPGRHGTRPLEEPDVVRAEPSLSIGLDTGWNEMEDLPGVAAPPQEDAVGIGGVFCCGVGGGAGGAFGGRRGGHLNRRGAGGGCFGGGCLARTMVTCPAEGDCLGRTIAPPQDEFSPFVDNPFVCVREEPLSTFGADVDTASWGVVRRMLREGRLPPRDAVRLEEMLNSFPYDCVTPSRADRIAVRLDAAACPWSPGHRLVRIALKAGVVDPRDRPDANLVFLVDRSGSMDAPDRLPLVKIGLRALVEGLTARDRVALVAYAGEAEVVLPSTPGDRKDEILAAIDGLGAGGGTNGAAGLALAYEQARAGFQGGGINRVVVATDGDFNLGVTGSALVERIAEEARTRVFLTVLGFGMGNLGDATLESLADRGNGSYAYVGDEADARRVLAGGLGGSLIAAAKDVKVQVAFHPARVYTYRLLGYENRRLDARDFEDDAKDAGDPGAGDSVTALYEVVPAGQEAGDRRLAPRASEPRDPREEPADEPLLTVRVRWKDPEGDLSFPIEESLRDTGGSFEAAPEDFRFAVSVAAFGMLLRHSPWAGGATLDWVRDTALGALGEDRSGARREFVECVGLAAALAGSDPAAPRRANE